MTTTDIVAAVETATRAEVAEELRAARFSLGASLIERGSDDPAGTLARIRARVADQGIPAPVTDGREQLVADLRALIAEKRNRNPTMRPYLLVDEVEAVIGGDQS